MVFRLTVSPCRFHRPWTYAPHITLMRNAFCPILPELAEPVAWRVRKWMLVKSEQTGNGSVYTPIRCWPLETSNKP